jgi:hypothetical protein
VLTLANRKRTSQVWREPSDPALDFVFAFEDVQGSSSLW